MPDRNSLANLSQAATQRRRDGSATVRRALPQLFLRLINLNSAPAVRKSMQHAGEAPGLWRRMACWLYEGVLLFGVVFIAGYLFGTLSQTRHAMDSRHLLQLFLFLIFGIYFVWFWSKGQTLAMKTWNLRIVDRQGGQLSQQRALIRYLWSWVWFLPPLVAVAFFELPVPEAGVLWVGWVAVWAVLSRFQPQRQFWHDALAGTRIVDARHR